MPFLSTQGMRKDFLKRGSIFQKVGDMGWSEYYGGQGIYSSIRKTSSDLGVLQDNNIKVYILSFLLWVIVLFFILG